MRLIDADLMIDDLRQEIVEHSLNGMKGTPAYTSDLKSMIDRLEDEDQAPTVDAVPVVRCKYCKHRPTKPDDYNPITTDGFALEFPDEKCPCQCGDGWYSKYPDDDWYCPIGEREGGDE